MAVNVHPAGTNGLAAAFRPMPKPDRPQNAVDPQSTISRQLDVDNPDVRENGGTIL